LTNQVPEGGGAGERACLAWLALTLTPGLGPTRIFRAIRKVGAAERLFHAPLTELEGLGLPAASAQFVFDGRALAAAEEELRRVLEQGATVVTPDEEAYPARLLEIFDPPTALWVRGRVELLNLPGIAVVGTRSPTPYGAGMAELLSRDLANRGMAILSGMARGVDTAAHKGALEANGPGAGGTVSVWGTGLDVVYPKENKRLAEQIVEGGGAIVTENPLGTFPAPQNFPIRNRILSGMSVGVLVIEAAEHSGTRITARCAMEQGRDVYAVPGNVTNRNAWGPNALIKQGAKLTATWQDVWEELPSQVRLQLEDKLALLGGNESKRLETASLFAETPGRSSSNLTGAETGQMAEHERLVFEHLRHDEAMQLDGLMEVLEGRLGPAEVFTALFELELSGRVRSMPGKNYVKAF
jgi:DNA processing protein